MRYCPFCNRSLGTQEVGVIVEGNLVHERCEEPYKVELRRQSMKVVRPLLHLPSLEKKCGDEL